MAQTRKREQIRWIVTDSKGAVIARMNDVTSEVARDVTLRRYGCRVQLITWRYASEAQRKQAELLPLTLIPKAGGVPEGSSQVRKMSASGGAS